MEKIIKKQLEHQIKYLQSLPILPLKINEGENEFQSIVVKSEKTMYVYLCGDLQHKIYNLPTFQVDKMSDLLLKVCSLTERYYNITADYKFVINVYNSMVEESL